MCVESYPEGAWYHYDDTTCDYECMSSEYFYWGLTTLMGAQAGYCDDEIANEFERPCRCDEIANEWQPCTPERLQAEDVLLYSLLTDSTYNLPTVLPDGGYYA